MSKNNSELWFFFPELLNWFCFYFIIFLHTFLCGII